MKGVKYMNKVSPQEAIILTQAKLKALADVLIEKGIVTEKELQEKYEIAYKDFQNQIINDEK